MGLTGEENKALLSSIIGLVLANTAVALRFTARWVGHIRVTVDDYLMLLALIPFWGIGIGGMLLTQNGLGQPLADIPYPNLQVFLKVQYTGTFVYTWTVTLTKMSILAMYWRVLPSQNVRKMVYICGSIVMLWTVGVCITGAIACLPVYKIWTPATPGKCINWAAFYYGMQIPNILTDIFIVFIPIREIFGLGFTRMQKYSLIGIFGIATLTIIFDIVRLVAMIEFSKSTEDFTVSIADVSVWTTIEPAVGIFAACLSNLRPLFKCVSQRASRLQRISSNHKEDHSTSTGDSRSYASDSTVVGNQSVDEAMKMEPIIHIVERRKSTPSV